MFFKPQKLRLLKAKRKIPICSQSLFIVKKQALRRAASSRSAATTAQLSVGFIPRDARIEVVSWPSF